MKNQKYKFKCNACYDGPKKGEGCFTNDITKKEHPCQDGTWKGGITPNWSKIKENK